MSLTAVDAESQRDVVHLQELLQKREYHLAELIDEVVFAEQERLKAVQEAHSVRELATHLEHAFDKLLQYHITMHKEVLLPTLAASVDACGGSSSNTPRRSPVSPSEREHDENAKRDDPGTASPANDFLNDLLTEPQLSQETKQLLQAVLQQRKAQNRATHSPAMPSRPNGANSQHRPTSEANEVAQRATHRAIVLSDSLLQNQETLTRLLRSIQDQAEGMLEQWASSPHASTSTRRETGASAHPAVAARPDPNIVLSPAYRTAESKRRASDVSSVAPFRLEHLHQHSERAREIEEALRSVEAERDALQRQLRERDAAPVATASTEEKAAWAKERVHLKQELAYAQQRALEEQARCRELKKQVAELERVAAASPIPAKAAPAPTSCSACAQTRAELKKKSVDYHSAKAAWKAEEQRLNGEVAALQRQVKDAAAALKKQQEKAQAAAAAAAMSAAAPSPPALDSSRNAAAVAGPSSERKIGQLEATVASMKADLQIMEMRMAIVQDEREAERRRILAAHEHERERLRRERDECQRIIDKMSRELQGLSRVTAAWPAIAGAST